MPNGSCVEEGRTEETLTRDRTDLSVCMRRRRASGRERDSWSVHGESAWCVVIVPPRAHPVVAVIDEMVSTAMCLNSAASAVCLIKARIGTNASVSPCGRVRLSAAASPQIGFGLAPPPVWLSFLARLVPAVFSSLLFPESRLGDDQDLRLP